MLIGSRNQGVGLRRTVHGLSSGCVSCVSCSGEGGGVLGNYCLGLRLSGLRGFSREGCLKGLKAWIGYYRGVV